MIKGGYTTFDFTSVVDSDDPVTIAGIYQKCKDTIGKPAIIFMDDTNTQWGWIVYNSGSYGVITQYYNLDDTINYAVLFQITNEDAVSIITFEPDDGE